MYAVIRVGGKQERVQPGDVIEVEFMKVDPGTEVEFEPLLVVDDKGKPHAGKALSQAKVKATLLGDKKGEKVRVFKYKNKTGYRRQMGHRQILTLLEIQEVGISPDQVARKPEAPAKKAPSEDVPKKAAAKKSAAKKAPAKKTAAKSPAKKAPATKTAAKKAAPKKTT